MIFVVLPLTSFYNHQKIQNARFYIMYLSDRGEGGESSDVKELRII